MYQKRIIDSCCRKIIIVRLKFRDRDLEIDHDVLKRFGGKFPLFFLLFYTKRAYIQNIYIVPRRLFFAAQQRIAITSSPNYYQKMQRFTTRKNQEEHGPEVK